MSEGKLTPREELLFAMIAISEARRTIVCSPDAESRIKCRVDAMGIAGIITVSATRSCPDGVAYVLNEGAIIAASNEILHREPIVYGPRPGE